MEDYV
jgi:hypothetical protein